MSNFPIKVGDSTGLDTYASTLTNGEEQLLITRDGKQYLTKGDGTKIEITDIITVSSLPSTNIKVGKIYILTSNFSLNYYDSSAWHMLGDSDQIVVGTSNADTTKLWLDISDSSKPILKYYIGSSWINISGDGNATSINSIIVNDSTRSNGRVLTYNNTTNNLEYTDVTISGIVGSSQITTLENVTIESGMEKVFNHPISTNIVPVIEEQIVGSSVTDTHVDFSDIGKYVSQGSKTIGVSSNKLKLLQSGGLDDNTVILLRGEGTSGSTVIVDSSLTPKTITNTNVVINTSNYKIGSGSLYFNGSSYVAVTGTTTDFNFNTNDWMIEFWIKLTATTNMPLITSTNYSYANSLGWCLDFTSARYLTYANGGASGAYRNIDIPTLADLTWHHIRIIKNGTTFGMLLDGSIKLNSTYASYSGSVSGINIGTYDTANASRAKAYIDNFRFEKGTFEIATYTPQSIEYYTYLNNTPLYAKTTGLSNFSLTTVDTITSLTIPVTLPSANTTCKCLVSFDNQNNWLYHDGTEWHKYTGDLNIAWTSSNLNTELQTYFTNKSIADLTSDLSSLGIVPISFDMAFQLNSQSTTETPTVSAITFVYITKPHTEFASYGNYTSTSAEFGVKRISNMQLGIKNLTTSSKTIKTNIIISS